MGIVVVLSAAAAPCPCVRHFGGDESLWMGNGRFVKFSWDQYPVQCKLRLLLGNKAGVIYNKIQSQVVVFLLAETGFILTC